MDPNYYKTAYMELESKIAKIAKYKLRDFIKYMAGGVTPRITEGDKYYANEKVGVPFLRVQNLSPEGLDCSECKYINEDTHNGLLKRSQVCEGDLLIKITGVGRMAITSIAPKGFKGNINQHIVVIKSKDPELNCQIAAFLNSDVGEMLATHRTTGGTRPALDYKALRSIPIVLNKKIQLIMEEAYKIKKEKIAEAHKILGTIDDYLLGELDICMVKKSNDIFQNRLFYVDSLNLLGGRFDPNKYSLKYKEIYEAVEKSRFKHILLKDLITDKISGNWGMDDTEKNEKLIKCLTIRATEFDNNYNLNLDNSRLKYRRYEESVYKKIRLKCNDILIEKSGGSNEQPVGRVAIINEEILNSNDSPLTFSNFIYKIEIDREQACPEYIFEYLSLMHSLKLTESMQSQTNGIRNLIMDEYLNQTVLLPDVKIQKKIVEKTESIRKQAKLLENEAENIVKKAQNEVKKILLGGE